MTGRAFALTRLAATASGPLTLVPTGGTADPVTPEQYSCFKHGDGLVARELGTALAEAFVSAHGRSLRGDVVVTSSGYDVAPPAAHALLAPFVGTLTRLLHDGGRRDATVRTVTVRRTRPSDGDYATMRGQDRAAALGRDDLRLVAGDEVRRAHVLALDDVRVTGVHERAMDAALRAAGARRVDHLYVVDAHRSGSDPTVESRLNAAAVAGTPDVVRMATSPGFVPNARVTRHLVGLDAVTLADVVAVLPLDVLRWLVEVGLRDRFADLPRYRRGAARLRGLAAERVGEHAAG